MRRDALVDEQHDIAVERLSGLRDCHRFLRAQVARQPFVSGKQRVGQRGIAARNALQPVTASQKRKAGEKGYYCEWHEGNDWAEAAVHLKSARWL